MNVAELQSAAKRYNFKSAMAFVTPMLICLVLVLLFFAVEKWCKTWVFAQFNEIVAEFIMIAPTLVVLVAAFSVAFVLCRRVERIYAVPCPHCEKNIANYRFIVVATKNCPLCGERVIET